MDYVSSFLLLAVLWFALHFLCLFGVIAWPEVRLKFARLSVSQRIVFALMGAAIGYFRNHSEIQTLLWLGSLPFFLTASYLARRHKKKVMDSFT